MCVCVCMCAGFIDYIVTPSFELCGDVLELLLSTPPPSPASSGSSDDPSLPTEGNQETVVVDKPRPIHPRRLWELHLQHNKQRWEHEETTASAGQAVQAGFL